MPTFDVQIEVTYRATVQVDARDRREARGMAERGPTAWYAPPPHLDHCHTEALDAWRQDSDGVDEMQAWRDKESA